MTFCDCEDQIVQTEPQPIDIDLATSEPAPAGPRIVVKRLTGVSEPLEPLYCRTCGEVIGVYEPLVMGHDLSRVTSRAAEPELLPPDGDYFHRSCFAGLDGLL